MAPKDAAPTKRARLTLSQLASYDDILTDALIDHVYYWSMIRKNRSKYNVMRGLSEDQVTDIIRNHLIVEHDAQTTEEQLLQLPGIKRYVERLKAKKEQEDFKRHLRKYINVWNNDCPFEISTTNRYTISTHEAAVIARREIEKGEVVKYLCGNLVSMTPEEEKDLGLTRRDFSIVMSSRKKTPSLFLGPARFANHDCRANARLVTTGSDGMQVVALRKISPNEEITVTYGEDYFGTNNCECLCRTCEVTERNGWSHMMSRPMPISVSEDDLFETFPRRSSRRLSSSGTATPHAFSPVPEHAQPPKRRRSESLAPAHKRSKLCFEMSNNSQPNSRSSSPHHLDETNNASSLMTEQQGGSNSTVAQQTLPSEDQLDQVSNLQSKESIPILAFEDVETEGHLPEILSEDNALEEARRKHFTERSGSATRDSIGPQLSSELSDCDSIFDPPSTDILLRSSDHTPLSISANSCSDCRERKASVEGTLAATHEAREAEESSTAPDQAREHNLPLAPASESSRMNSLDHVKSERAISPSSSVHEHLGIPPNAQYTPVNILAQTDQNKPILHTLKAEDLQYPDQRRRGDYTRTQLLLTTPSSRWVDCRTCTATWVQAEGRLTKRECPRCERHSKLYGYQWPKTEQGQLSWLGGQPAILIKQGKKRAPKGRPEREDRILDHRTVYRFIDPNQEKIEQQKGRGLEAPSEEIIAALAACEPYIKDESEEEIAPTKGHRHAKGVGRMAGKKGRSKPSERKVHGIKTKKAHILKGSKKSLSAKARSSSENLKNSAKRILGRTGSHSKLDKGLESGKIQKRKRKDVFDIPSDSEDEEALRKSSKVAKEKSKQAKKSAKNAPKGWAWVKVRAPKPKPKPGWRGWVELPEGQTRPQTMEEAMAYPTATGTRRGTQLGRRDYFYQPIVHDSPVKQPMEDAKVGDGSDSPVAPPISSTINDDHEESRDEDGEVDMIGVSDLDQSEGPEKFETHEV